MKKAAWTLLFGLCLALWAGAAEVPKGVRIHRDQTVSVSLQAADLRAVVTALARTFDINIVGSDKLTGQVTLHLQNVPARQALAVILKNAGFVMVQKDGDIVEILTEAEAAKARQQEEKATVRIFKLKYAAPSVVAKLLVPNVIPDAQSIAQVPDGNQLLVKGTRSQLAEVERVIQEVDVPVPQVAIRARIVEINIDRAKKLGISVTISGLCNDGTADFDLAQATSAVRTFNFAFLTSNIDAKIDALVQKDVAEVLSAPSITTAHGRAANIKVVNQVPYITRTTRVVDGVTVTDESITFKETGLTLEVTPRVLADGQIQMLVKPAVLELTGYTDTDPPAPIIDTRSADTDVTLSDGKWLVIGGLMRSHERVFERGIPFLMHLPVIGDLFRSSQTTHEKSNLIILVSGTVLTPRRTDADTKQVEQDIQDFRRIHRLRGHRFFRRKPDNVEYLSDEDLRRPRRPLVRKRAAGSRPAARPKAKAATARRSAGGKPQAPPPNAAPRAATPGAGMPLSADPARFEGADLLDRVRPPDLEEARLRKDE